MVFLYQVGLRVENLGASPCSDANEPVVVVFCRASTPICPSVWPPSPPTCRTCFLLESTTPSTCVSLSCAWPPPIWSTPTRSGEHPPRWSPELDQADVRLCDHSPFSSKLDSSRGAALGQATPTLHVQFCQYATHMSSYVDYRVCPELSPAAGQTDLCQQFSVSFCLLL